MAGTESLFYCARCQSTAHGPDTVCHLDGKCVFCKTRPAALYFGDSLSFSHGGSENCCPLCAAEMQLAHAKQQASLIPEREAEVARLRAEMAE